MAKEIYVGVGGRARKAKTLYVGIGGVARSVKKIYVGVGGKARLAWEDLSESFTATLTAQFEGRYGLEYRSCPLSFTRNQGSSFYTASIGGGYWTLNYPTQAFIQSFYLEGCPTAVLEKFQHAGSNGAGLGVLDWTLEGTRIVCPSLPPNGFVLENFSMKIRVS